MRPNGRPIAVVPLGTANNIAKSLGIGQPNIELIASWHAEKMIDIPTGLVLFQWDSLDHVPLSATYEQLPQQSAKDHNPFD